MWRFVVAAPFMVHGLAHISGFLASWTSVDAGYSARPWLFSPNVSLQSITGRVFGLLWLTAMTGLVGAALGLATRQSWWVPTAILASAISLAVILPWWNTIPPGAKVGAAFDLLVIGLLISPAREWLLALVQ